MLVHIVVKSVNILTQHKSGATTEYILCILKSCKTNKFRGETAERKTEEKK